MIDIFILIAKYFLLVKKLFIFLINISNTNYIRKKSTFLLFEN